METGNKKIIDTRGVQCPGPQRVLEVLLRYIEKGTIIELLADDPESKIDIKFICNVMGATLLSMNEKDRTIMFTIRKD